MVSYGWTIDYINDCVTIPQIMFLLDTMKQNPPTAIMSFGFGERSQEDKLMKQVSSLGDKVKTQRTIDKSSVKSIVRLRDKVKIK